MMKSRLAFAVILVTLGATAIAQAQLACPGYNPKPNVNLACAVATSAPSQAQAGTAGLGSTVSFAVGSTMATQLSQLPIATAVSGAGLVFNPQLGVFEASKDNGPILTQRGDTIGRHKLFLSFTYQRFSFDEVDGIDLKNLQIVNTLNNGSTTLFSVNPLRIDFRIDQFVAVATYGLTRRVDVSFIVPFSEVTLKSQRVPGATLYTVSGGSLLGTPSSLGTNSYPGSATGIGDVTLSVKANVFRSSSEKTSIAIGGQVRMPSGDAINYLGTGAYGIKPYLVISHRGRVTPNFSVAYQWNGVSALNVDSTGKSLNLPSSFMYSGGVDVQVVKRLSLAGELLGQAVINGPRLATETAHITPAIAPTTVATTNGSYAMNNASLGFKLNPFGGLLVTGSALIRLDNAGLRAHVVPMVGLAYRF